MFHPEINRKFNFVAQDLHQRGNFTYKINFKLHHSSKMIQFLEKLSFMDKIDEQYFDDSQDKNNYMTKFQIDFRVYIYIYSHGLESC